MKYRWIVFDADGTLFDYDTAESRALEESFLEAGLAFEPGFVDMYRTINQKVWSDFENGSISQERLRTQRFQTLFEASGSEYDPATFSSIYLSNLSKHADLIDGAEETVRLLKGRVRLGLITNGIAVVQRSRLARSSIGGSFRTVVISGEVGFAKPDKRIFDELFLRMGNPPRNEVLLVGDSLASDMRGGADYGLDTCWFNPSGGTRDEDIRITYEIGDLSDLPGIVQAD